MAETDGTNVINKYYRGANGIMYANLDGTITRYVKDGHGNVTGLTDVGATTLTKTYNYDAFGVEIDKDESDINPFRYCGEYYDNELDKIYLRARYYSPIQGRFMTEDPIKDGLNWYAYCSGDPVNYWDFMGLLRTPVQEIQEKIMELLVLKAEYEKLDAEYHGDLPNGVEKKSDDFYIERFNTLTQLADEKRQEILDCEFLEFDSDLGSFFEDVLEDGANVTIEDTSALLVVIASINDSWQINDVRGKSDITREGLNRTWEKACNRNILYYISKDKNTLQLLNNYFPKGYVVTSPYIYVKDKKMAHDAYPLADQESLEYNADGT